MFEPENLPPPDENGLFLHPDIPDTEEGESLRARCAALGFDCSFVSLDDDAPRAFVDAYFEEGLPDVPARWNPTPSSMSPNVIICASHPAQCQPPAAAAPLRRRS